MAKPVHITDTSFEVEVIKYDIPFLTDFCAEWCGPCRVIAPVLEEIADEYDGQLKVVKLDVDENTQIPTEYGIRGIPTLILFKNGEPVERLVGAIPKRQLLSHIQLHLPVN